MRFGLNEDIINTINKIFEANSRVDKAIVFGSRAKGNYRPDSDIDLAIKGADITLDDILKMQVAFEENEIKYKVDLVHYNTIKEKALIEHINRVGSEFYTRWKEYKLGNLIDIKHGFAFKGEMITDEPTNNILVTPGNFHIGGGFKKSKYKYFKGQVPDDYILEQGDIIITMTDLSQGTDTLGYSAKVPKQHGINFLHNQRIGLIRFISNEAEKDFIYWLMRTKDYQNFIASSSSGTSIMHTAPSRVKDYTFFLPPIPEQISIAEILSSLDNKADLLHCQNKTLEQLAEAMFRQWFIEEAEENWEEDVLEKYVSFDPGEKIDRSREYQFFEMKCLSNVDMNVSDGIYRSVSSASSFRNFDTLLAKITPCLENGKTGFVMHLGDDEVARGSTEFIVMRSKGLVSPYWIYCLARDNDFREKAIQSMTGTSGRQRVQIDLLKNIRVKVDTKKMKEFHEAVSTYFFKIKSNQIQIRTLTQLRDALLPKLMTGEVRVAI